MRLWKARPICAWGKNEYNWSLGGRNESCASMRFCA